MSESDNWGLIDNWCTATERIELNGLEWRPDYNQIDLNVFDWNTSAISCNGISAKNSSFLFNVLIKILFF